MLNEDKYNLHRNPEILQTALCPEGMMRTYGRWWDECPSSIKTIMPQTVGEFESQDFVEFVRAVYPTRMNILGVSHPGTVVKIWAADDKENWELLWKAEPRKLKHFSHEMRPRVRKLHFPTRLLRLEFRHSHLDYYADVHSVELYGTFLPYVHRNAQNQLAHVSTLLPAVILRSLVRLPEAPDITDVQAVAGNGNHFNCLSDETVLHVFGFLDLVSLCKCAQVSKRFCNLAYDSFLFKELNLKVYWHSITASALNNLEQRCQQLKMLDLSWCGSMSRLKPYEFNDFIIRCGMKLTHLRLNSCLFLDSLCLRNIATYCDELKELSLKYCVNLDGQAFIRLSNLRKLENLNLNQTGIEVGTLQSVLQNLPRLKHLNIVASQCVCRMLHIPAELVDCVGCMVLLSLSSKTSG